MKLKLSTFLSDSYSSLNLGSRVPLEITFRALFERKNSLTQTFVKQQTFFESKSIIFRFVRMPIWNLESFCTFGPMGHWAKPRSGQYFFFGHFVFLRHVYHFGGNFGHNLNPQAGNCWLNRPKMSYFGLYAVPMYV